MPGSGSLHLILHASHTPRCTDVVLIVGVNINVATSHIRRGDIVNQRFPVSGRGTAQCLGNTGSQRGGLAGIHAVIVVAGLVGDNSRQLIQIVGKCIAAGNAQIPDIRQSAAGFQRGDSRIASIGVEHRRTDLLFSADTGETVSHQKFRAELICEVAIKVTVHDCADCLAVRKIAHNVVGIQIAIQIQNTKAMDIIILGRIVIAQVLSVGAQLVCHILHSGGCKGTVLLCVINKIANVAPPAAKVTIDRRGRCVGLHGVVGDVHTAEHMHKVHLVPIGQGKLRQAPQRAGSGTIGCVLIRHVLGKVGLLLARQHGPATAGIFFHAATDIVDDQPHCVLPGMLTGICLRIALQHLQIPKKGIILRRILRRLCRNRAFNPRHIPLSAQCKGIDRKKSREEHDNRQTGCKHLFGHFSSHGILLYFIFILFFYYTFSYLSCFVQKPVCGLTQKQTDNFIFQGSPVRMRHFRWRYGISGT